MKDLDKIDILGFDKESLEAFSEFCYESNNNLSLSEYEDNNYKMYKDFINEYSLNKYGGISLLRRLLDRLLGKENANEIDIHDREINCYIDYYKKEHKMI